VKELSKAENIKSILIMAVVFGFVIYVLVRPWYVDYAIRKNFRGKIPNLIDQDLDQKYRRGMRYRRGKVVIINIDDREIDSLHMKLPSDIRAYDPSEVDTIVWITRKQVNRGNYVDMKDKSRVIGKANVHVWKLTVIDVKNKRIVYYKNIYGSAPFSVAIGEGDSSGLKPSSYDMVDYIKSLPN